MRCERRGAKGGPRLFARAPGQRCHHHGPKRVKLREYKSQEREVREVSALARRSPPDFPGMGTTRHPLKCHFYFFFASIYAFTHMAEVNSPEHVRSYHTCVALFAHC